MGQPCLDGLSGSASDWRFGVLNPKLLLMPFVWTQVNVTNIVKSFEEFRRNINVHLADERRKSNQAKDFYSTFL